MASRKKTAKKRVAKRKVTKRKPAAKRKPTARRKVAARKKVATKRTPAAKRKLTAKKKTAAKRKPAARRKVAKRAQAVARVPWKPGRPGKPGRPLRPKAIRIVLANNGPGPTPKASRKNRDTVRWVSKATVDFTLTFTAGEWPFEGQQLAISVPAGGASSVYTVNKDTPNQDYDYTANPPFDVADTPPGEPVITVED